MGSISAYQTAGGKRYRVRYRTPDHVQAEKRGFRGKRDAEIHLASVEVSKARGEYVDAAAARATIGQLGTDWLASQTHLKASSLAPVEGAWRLYVSPRWEEVEVGKIRHSEVQAWISELGDGTAKTLHTSPGPRGATHVLRAYGVLAAILDVAVRDRRIVTNPARGVKLPRKTKKPHTYLSHEQVDLLARSATNHETVVLTLGYTGLRWGELVGLRVRDLDALRRRLTVRENAVKVGGKIIVGTPKSHEARSVPFPAFLSEPLARLCEGKNPEMMLFGDGVSYLRTPSTRDGWLVYALRRAREVDPAFPRLSLHDLRHTAASLAISSGANVKAVQRMLGHASAAMTLDTYADLFDDDLDGVALALDHARTNSNVGELWGKPGTEAVVSELKARSR